MQETPLTFQDGARNTIAAILAEPENKTGRAVILCHGFLSNKDSRTNLRLTELHVAQGISTLRFDWFGMGESEGEFGRITVPTCCDQLERAISLMRERGYHELGLTGSSFGGLLAILVGQHHPELRTIGLKCPVPDFPEMLDHEFGSNGIEEWKRTNYIPDVTGGTAPVALDFAFYESCRAVDAYAAARNIKVPVLIVHGEQDELVPFHQIRRLEEALPGDTKLVLLPEADHQFGRPEDFRRMTVHLADWMQSHLPGTNRS
ncbi:MAG: alpha/beta hydrolase [Nitrospira sp.]|nr:alpha/beta hydrolase [Nitrospira sp.]MCY3954852.1 alpha/beta hydrolase [Nitrospira sp.]MCY4131335.1 alpha/beta hydrolase [Nitrospira sp.]